MTPKQQNDLAHRLRAETPSERWSHAPQSMRNSASAYVDPGRYDDEMAALFLDGPVFVCLSSECALPGAYVTRDIAGVPIVVVRQKDGALRAFLNICRHRAAPLLSGDGKKGRLIVCPYHAWGYDLSGRLVSRPESEGGFDDVTGDCNLINRAVQELHGLIFVRASSDEPFDIDEKLAGMESEFSGYGLETAHPIETRTMTWDMNWKLVIDTFIEAYHVRYLHQETIDPVFLSHQLYDDFGGAPRVIGLRKSILNQFETEPAADWRLFPHAAALYTLMPNAFLVYQGDHVETWRVEPISVDKCRVFVTLFSPSPPADDKSLAYWIKNLEVACRVTFTEDFPMQTRIHANMKTGAIDEVLYGKNEPGLVQFHSTVNETVDRHKALNRSGKIVAAQA
jgi:phenylpropionate dioxygenase-like ring-hydroxylating dioxygenase large terminal subunit